MHNKKLSDVDVRAAVGQAIARRREELGMTQAEAAILIGIPQGSLSRIERGGAPATVTMIAHVAEALHTSPWLLVAQAIGTQREQRMAEQIQEVMTFRPAVWKTVVALLTRGAAETVP